MSHTSSPRRLRGLAILGLASLLGACATAPENMPRVVDFDWNLAPSATSPTPKRVEQGDVILTWDATTRATHSATIDGAVVPLTLARTTRGNLYCASGETRDRCYEDRDSDQKLDHAWKPYRADKSIGTYRIVSGASALDAPIALSTVDGADTVMSGVLGLLYDGPARGLISDAGRFDVMFGFFKIGWLAGLDVPRDPTGAGWQPVNLLGFVGGDETPSPKAIFDRLGLTLEPKTVHIDGSMDLVLDAQPVTGVNVREKLEVDFADEELPFGTDDMVES